MKEEEERKKYLEKFLEVSDLKKLLVGLLKSSLSRGMGEYKKYVAEFSDMSSNEYKKFLTTILKNYLSHGGKVRRISWVALYENGIVEKLAGFTYLSQQDVEKPKIFLPGTEFLLERDREYYGIKIVGEGEEWKKVGRVGIVVETFAQSPKEAEEKINKLVSYLSEDLRKYLL